MFQFVEEIKKGINERQVKQARLQSDINAKYKEVQALKNELGAKEKEYGQTLDDVLLNDINTLRNDLEEAAKQHNRMKDNLNLIQEYKGTCDSEAIIKEIKEAVKKGQFEKKRNALREASDEYINQLKEYSDSLSGFITEINVIKSLEKNIDDETMKVISKVINDSFSGLGINMSDGISTSPKASAEESYIWSIMNNVTTLALFE